MARPKGGAKGQRGGANGQRAERRQSESQERPQTTQKNGRQGRSPTPADDLSPHKGRQKPKEQATAAGPSDG